MIGFYDILALAVSALAVGVGFATSRSPRLRRLRLWRWALAGVAGVLLMLPLSALLGSDTLGWMAGLSLLFLLPVLLLFGVGAVLGHWLATGSKDEARVTPAATRATWRPALEFLRQRSDLLLVVAGVGAGFAVVIGTGFRISGDRAPEAVAIAYVPAIAILAGVLATFSWRIAQNWHYRRSDPNSTRELRRWKAERQQLLVVLAADPVRHRYLALIERGENWTAGAIEYDLDPDITTTCEHLRPIEHAIRKAGIRVRLQWAGVVDARCMVDAQAMLQQFNPAPSVAYTEPHFYDRSMEDPPSALISCSTCMCCIHVVHCIFAAEDTPTWPGLAA